MPATTRPLALLAVAALAFVSAPPAPAGDADEIQTLREQIRQLDQKIRVLERRQELRDEDAATVATTAAKVTVTDKGFTLASADSANVLRLRGLVQGDSRWYFGDKLNNNDAFVLRRARLIFEGTFNRIYQFQLVPEFGGASGNGTLTLLDANLNVAFQPWLQVRVGRFRPPVGLEQLQADSVAFFAERSVVSQLVPNRDLGVQLWGDALNGTLGYAAGVFDGSPDGTNNPTNADTNNKKDLAARVFVQPFKNAAASLAGLGFGVAGTYGHQNGSAGGLTSGYRTDGQQTFFAYRSTTVAKGPAWRVSPQLYYYDGPLGVLAEAVVSSVAVRNGPVLRSLQHRAWQVSAGYVLTGENAGYAGVVPRRNFDLSAGTWGAFELVGRASGADLDAGAFTGGGSSVANPASAAAGDRAFGFGLNWYPAKTVRASFDFFHTRFAFAPGVVPAATTVIGNDENALITRLQLVF